MTGNFVERGSGQPVLFLHGVGSDAGGFAPQLDHFGTAYRAMAWNMPGYGGAEPLEEMTFPALARALAAELDQLGIARVHFVGHSLGGMVAQEFAALFPDRLLTLTLYATSASFGRPDGEFQQKFIADRLAPIEAGQSLADMAPSTIDAMMGKHADTQGREIAIASMGRVPTAAYVQAVRCIVSFNQRDALARITVPTLLIAGSVDANAPAPMMARMAERISGAEFVVLDGLNHMAHLENPILFNETLARFLDRQAA